MSIDSLHTYLDFLTSHNYDDPALYEWLAELNASRVATLIARLDRVEHAPAPKGKAAAAFRSRRSNLKGRLYEILVGEIVRGVRCFSSATRVSSSTNEIDLLLMLGPSSQFVPALRQWNTHCLCECKYHDSHVKNDWVSKLNTVMQTHGASVGLLISRKGIAASGNGAKIRTLLQMLANRAAPSYVVCLDWSDLQACIDGRNFLQLVSERFVEVRVGSKKFSLLAS